MSDLIKFQRIKLKLIGPGIDLIPIVIVFKEKRGKTFKENNIDKYQLI